MALGTTVTYKTTGTNVGNISQPVQLNSFWMTACDNSEQQDSSGTITNPLSHITDSDKRIISVPHGTNLVVCHRYTDGATVSTAPVVQVFGRTVSPLREQGASDTTSSNSVGGFMRLVNKAGQVDIPLSDSTTDLDDGTFEYTTVDPDAHVVDLMGCNQVLIGIKTAAAYGTGGDVGDIIVKVI
mgnify:FL=1